MTEYSLINITARLSGQIASSYGQVKREMNNIQTQAQRSYAQGRQLVSFGRDMMFAFTLPIVMMGRAIIQTGVEYNRHMNVIRGITGATAGEMDHINTSIRNMSISFRRSPMELAAGMERLAQAYGETFRGPDGLQNMIDFLPHATRLSILAGTNLEETSNSLINIMNQYHVPIQRMGEVNDLLVNTFMATTAELPDLMQGLRQVGSIGYGVGISLNEIVSALGLLRQSGLQAGQSGTYLRNVIQRLAAPAGEGRDTMRQFGLQLIRNEDGSTNFLQTLLRIRNLYQSGLMTRRQLLTLGSPRTGGAALLQLVNLEEGAFQRMINRTTEGGSTERLLQEYFRGLPGAMDRLSSAWDRLKVSFTQGELQYALASILNLISGIVEWFERLSPTTKKWIIYILALLAVLPIFVFFLGQLKMALLVLPNAIKGVGKALTWLAAHPIIAILMVLTLIIIALVQWWQEFREELETTETITQGLGRVIYELANAFGWVLDVINFFNWLSDAIEGLWNNLDLLGDMFSDLGALVRTISTGNISDVPAQWAAFQASRRRLGEGMDPYLRGNRVFSSSELINMGLRGMHGENPANPWYTGPARQENGLILGLAQMNESLNDIERNTRGRRGGGLDFTRGFPLGGIVFTGQSPWHYGMSLAHRN